MNIASLTITVQEAKNGFVVHVQGGKPELAEVHVCHTESTLKDLLQEVSTKSIGRLAALGSEPERDGNDFTFAEIEQFRRFYDQLKK